MKKHFIYSLFILTLTFNSILAFGDCEKPIPKQPVMVFDLTGSFQGWGDVIGSLWSFVDLKKRLPRAKYYLVTDKRAQDILLKVFQLKTLMEVQETLGVEKIVDQKESAHIPKANFAFQLFVGGRKIDDFNTNFTDKHSVIIIADTMHGHQLSEMRMGDNHLFFKPPGLGKERSGVMSDPYQEIFYGKDPEQRKRLAASFFQGTSYSHLRKLLDGTLSPHAQISFLYGAHNEQYAVKGQTLGYLNALADNLPISKGPIFVLTPNTLSDLSKLGIQNDTHRQLLSLNDFNTMNRFEHKLYIVSLGSISGKEFTGLIGASDFPVLLEGNNSISVAIRMHRPFLVYRSAWNKPFIQDLMNIETHSLGTNFFSPVYERNMQDETVPPDFQKSVFLDNTHPHGKQEMSLLYSRLSTYVNDFSDTLVVLIRTAQTLERISCSHESSLQKERQILQLSSKVYEKIHDQYLSYSIVLNAAAHQLVSPAGLVDKQQELARAGYQYKQLQSRFTIIPGGFGHHTVKARVLTQHGVKDEDEVN